MELKYNNKEFHGIWRIMPSSSITEIIGNSGFDFQILDCEHGSYDYDTLANDIRVCELTKCESIIRVSGLNKVEVQRCLDLGANGIIFPQLRDYKDFEIATKLMKYAPIGIRGYNPFVRAFAYGSSNYVNNKHPICLTIIETLEAIKDLDKILTLEGIDIIYIGSYDLSAQLGCVGQMDNPKLLSTIELIIQKCKLASKSVSLMVNNKSQYEIYKSKGVDIFLHSIDSYNIQHLFSDIIKQYK
ncbi:MAG: aldolase/citrate lyase family protein [Bacteroidales bacterium]|nr:aldolase/citrate lyase family protein [Bacteroidales bacterium]